MILIGDIMRPIKKTTGQFLQELQVRNTQYSAIEFVLPQEYNGTRTKHTFQCLLRHHFETTPFNILHGFGCNRCGSKEAGNKNRKSHDNFLTKLSDRNIRTPDRPVTLAPNQTYKGTYEELTFICKDGHYWSAIPKTVLRGSYCPECKSKTVAASHRYDTIIFKGKLQERNTQLPNKNTILLENQDYIGFRDQLSFSCDRGHIWKTTPDNILNGKSGCPTCSQRGFSYKALDWLSQFPNIQHIKNGGEYIIPGTRYRVDGFDSSTNTIYEFYGDYWHGNPSIHHKDDINEKANITFGELYERMIAREKQLRELGYNIVTIWESEFIAQKHNREFYNFVSTLSFPATFKVNMWKFDSTYQQVTQDRYFLLKRRDSTITTLDVFEDEWELHPELVKSKILHYANKSTAKKIGARQCRLELISPNVKSPFLNTYHIQGNDNSQIAIGAYINTELVAVMTFSAPRVALGQKNRTRESTAGVFELVRFATHSNYHIQGIASRLLTYFQKNFSWQTIYSYADIRWSTGNLYHKLGFQLTKVNPPDYYYVVDNKRRHRWNYRKDILKNTLPNYNPTLTEYQNMLNHGIDRVWDCGTMKFTITNDKRP